MPFIPSLSESSGPGEVFTARPELYRHWSEMSQTLMNGESELSAGERELVAGFVAGLVPCEYAYVAHSEAAYAWGIEAGLIESLLEDDSHAAACPRLRPVLAFVRKLTLAPATLSATDANAVFDAGWSEQGLHDAIAVAARMHFMSRLIFGHGFVPMTRERARANAAARREKGYVGLYPAFAEEKG